MTRIEDSKAYISSTISYICNIRYCEENENIKEIMHIKNNIII